MSKRIAFIGAGLLAALTAMPAAAQEAEKDPFLKVSGNVAIVSDYRFRGISLSDKDWALQGALRVDSEPGFYIATWASSIETLTGTDGGTAETEIDVYGGWTGKIAGLTADVGLYSYLYPGAEGLNYFEAYGALGYAFGPVSTLVGINYAPDQSNLFEDNFYLYGQASAGIPGTPITLTGRLGYENGAFADEKIDWLIGAGVTWKALTFAVQYVDTNKDFRLAGSGVVFSVTGAF